MFNDEIIFCSLILIVFCMQARSIHTIQVRDYAADTGKNVTIPCITKLKTKSIMWLKEPEDNLSSTRIILNNGSLLLKNVTTNHSGNYTCYTIVPQSISNNNNNDNKSINDTADNVSGPETTIGESSLTMFNDSQLIANNRVYLRVRTPPNAVAHLHARVTTIVGVLMWKFYDRDSGGYAIKYFTADFRKLPENETLEDITPWIRLDPSHITPNARQLEIYGLKPNTTYQFRMYATNYLGPGTVKVIYATTKPEMQEEDLARILLSGAEIFDTRVWVIAVSIVLGTLLLLTIGISILLWKECGESVAGYNDSVELVPNIILNPGYAEPDDKNYRYIYKRSMLFDTTYNSDDDESMTFKKRISHFFTGDSIKRL